MKSGSRSPRGVPAPARPPGPLASVLAGVAVLGVSLLLAPGVPGDKDASEFTLVLARLGCAHPTGYPLYTLVGHRARRRASSRRAKSGAGT